MGVGEERRATNERRAHSGGWLYASRYPRDHDKYTIKGNDVNVENTNQTHVKQHAR